MGDTAAQKRGDLVDLLLLQRAEAEKRFEIEQFADYPEQVLGILRAFYKVWKLPEGAIPPKKKKGKYELWVSDLGQLNELFGSESQYEEAFTIALERYNQLKNKFPVWHPLSIQSLLVHALGEMKRKRAEADAKEKLLAAQQAEEEAKRNIVYVTADKFAALRERLRSKEE